VVEADSNLTDWVKTPSFGQMVTTLRKKLKEGGEDSNGQPELPLPTEPAKEPSKPATTATSNELTTDQVVRLAADKAEADITYALTTLKAIMKKTGYSASKIRSLCDLL
jgi:hypothetical protein